MMAWHISTLIVSNPSNATWSEHAKDALEKRLHTVYCGDHITWSTLFYQNAELVTQWHKAGYLGVDMETATTYAVGNYFKMPAISMLVVWDDLTRGRSFLDPLSDSALDALNRANESVYEVALDLIEKL